jgi:hypothetical protein
MPDRSVSRGREVVDTAFDGLHSWGRAEELHPPDGTSG